MPTIVRLPSCVLYIYANDHNPPHFHVRTRESEAVILINELTVAAGAVDKLALKEALDWAAENGDVLRERWNDLND